MYRGNIAVRLLFVRNVRRARILSGSRDNVGNGGITAYRIRRKALIRAFVLLLRFTRGAAAFVCRRLRRFRYQLRIVSVRLILYIRKIFLLQIRRREKDRSPGPFFLAEDRSSGRTFFIRNERDRRFRRVYRSASFVRIRIHGTVSRGDIRKLFHGLRFTRKFAFSSCFARLPVSASASYVGLSQQR